MKISLNPQAAIPAHYMNRHCLITGPTGTGKTVSIMKLMESLSKAGTPVLAPDVKGDLPPLADTILSPAKGLFVPLHIIGADLLARALELTDAQAGALEIAFSYADETQSPLDSLADLRAILADLAASPESVAHLGHITRASVGTIQRALLRIERQGQGGIFGPSSFDITQALESGLVTVIDASALYHAPRIYGAFMLWLLREIATRFPEVGDLDKPRLALVIDEAHCLFHEASPALLRSIEATARLIRSKGVALVFASQSPDDLPQVIQAQCATRIEHERALGVGNCRFTTLDARGNATKPQVIRPSLPDCFTNPKTPQRQAAPIATSPRPMPDPSPAARLPLADKGDIGFLSACALALLALGYWIGAT